MQTTSSTLDIADTESFVAAFGNLQCISLLRCSNYQNMSAMSANFSLCAVPCFTNKQDGD